MEAFPDVVGVPSLPLEEGGEGLGLPYHVGLAEHPVVGPHGYVRAVLQHPDHRGLLAEVGVGRRAYHYRDLGLGALRHVVVGRLAHVYHECGVQGQYGIDVLPHPLAGVDREYLPGLADFVRHGLDVAHGHVGYAGYAYAVGNGQDRRNFFRIIIGRYRAAKDYSIRTALPEHPAAFGAALPEIYEC